MKKHELNRYVGKFVVIELFDKTRLAGFLYYSEYSEVFCAGNHTFKSSNVKNIRLLKPRKRG